MSPRDVGRAIKVGISPSRPSNASIEASHLLAPTPVDRPSAPPVPAMPPGVGRDGFAIALPQPAPSLSDDAMLGRLVQAREGRRPVRDGSVTGDWRTIAAEAIAAGRAARKSAGPEGTEKVLSPTHEKRVQTLLARADAQVVHSMASQLAGIDGPGAQLGRALYLKAAAARSHALLGSDPAARAAALSTLDAFAGRVRTMDSAELLRRSSVIDLDSRVSTSDFEPLSLERRSGGTREIGQGDARTDNDGLIQRFKGSCGPTSVQIALCEEDPVRAFVVHDAGLTSASPDDIAGRFQAEMLSQYASAARSRLAARNRVRVRNGAEQLEASGKLRPAEAKALNEYVKGSSASRSTERVNKALTQLRELTGGFPTAAELEQMRLDPKKAEGGLGFDEFESLINRMLSPVTGQVYRQTEPKDGIKPGEAGKHLDAVAAALRRGIDVPFGLVEAEHWMVLTAVEGREPKRRFLVADPFSGRTDWVSEDRLVSGDFSADPFELVGPKVKDHIDSFFLPVPATSPPG